MKWIRKIIAFSLMMLMIVSSSLTVFADENTDTGSGNAGDTDNRQSYWRSDATGYRVTVLDKTNG